MSSRSKRTLFGALNGGNTRNRMRAAVRDEKAARETRKNLFQREEKIEIQQRININFWSTGGPKLKKLGTTPTHEGSTNAGPKYHIGNDGMAKPCNAELRACPLGKNGIHFYTPHDKDAIPAILQIVTAKNNYNTRGRDIYEDVKFSGEETLDPRALVERLGRGDQDSDIIGKIQGEVDFVNDNFEPGSHAKLTRRVIGNYPAGYGESATYQLEGEFGLLEIDTNKIGNGEFLKDEVESFIIDSSIKHAIRPAIRSSDPNKNREIYYGGDKFPEIAPNKKTLSTPAEQRDFREELAHNIENYIMTVEQESALSNQPFALTNSNSRIHWFDTSEDGTINGSIDYATTGFRPAHLRHMNSIVNTRESFNRKIVGRIGAISVTDNSAADGLAAWNIDKDENDNWEITVRGSRGKIETVSVATPEQGEKEFSRMLKKGIKLRDGKSDNFRNEVDLFKSENADEYLSKRTKFVGDLIRETQARNKIIDAKTKIEKEEEATALHKELFKREGESRHIDGFLDSLF